MALDKERLRFDERFGEAIDFAARIIKSEGCAATRGLAELREERHGAMRPGAHGDAGAIDHRGDVMRMRVVEIESDDRPLVGRTPVNVKSRYA